MRPRDDIPAGEAFLGRIVEDARRSLALKRVVLFGSRARGDARESSDYDLAFEHGSTDAQWCAFVNRTQDEALTLSDLDLLDWRQASPALRERVRREGIVLYG